MINNHPSYKCPEFCQQPILVSKFNEETSNTDESFNITIENDFEGGQMIFAVSNDLTRESGPY